MKFKIGDKVKVVSGEDAARDAKTGDVGVIIAVDPTSCLPYGVKFEVARPWYHSLGYKCENNHGYWCAESMLELVYKDSIIIYRDGQKVIAEDKNTGEKAMARCNPSDKFDFRIGAKLAFERLTCAVKEKVKFASDMAIWCDNKYQFDELMKVLESAGYKWAFGDLPTKYYPPLYANGTRIFLTSENTTFYGFPSDKPDGFTYVDFSDVDFSDCVQKIKVGDYVRVTNPLQSHSRYTDFFKEYTEDIPVDVAVRFMYLKQPEKDKRYKVLYLKKHPTGENDVYVIENADGEVYLIDAKGVEKW